MIDDTDEQNKFADALNAALGHGNEADQQAFAERMDAELTAFHQRWADAQRDPPPVYYT